MTITHDPEFDQEFDNTHRCHDCGVTGGGVENGLCEGCHDQRIRDNA